MDNYLFTCFCFQSGVSDYKDIPYNFLFTPNETRHCFDVVLINDNRYEVREEFFVNLTTNTTEAVNLNPHFTIIRVDDDDSKC